MNTDKKTRPDRGRWLWIGTLILAVMAFVAGFIGFDRHFQDLGESQSVFYIAYLSLQLFTLESGAVAGPIGLELQIARFLAPAVAAYAAVNGLMVLFSKQVQSVRLWFIRNHVIVCGLGEKGAWLVRQLRARRRRVVVIEKDEGNDDVAYCRELGAIVLTGGSDDRWLLQKAVVHRAAELIAVTGEDRTNVETAVLAHHLRRSGGDRPLRCITHVVDFDLQDMFKRHDIYADDSLFDLQFFNAFETAARVMLRESIVFYPPDTTGSESRHLLIVGSGGLGEALFLRAAKDWRIDRESQYGRLDPNSRLQITVIAKDALEKEEWLRTRYPDLLSVCSARFVRLDVRSEAFSRGEFLNGESGDVEISSAFVCLNDDSLGMLTGLALRKQLKDRHVSIGVQLSEEAGFGTLLGASPSEGAIDGVWAVGLLDITCSLDLVLGGPQEAIAQTIHQGYVAKQRREGHTEKTNESLVPWRDLPEHLRESNRKQAADIGRKLRAINCSYHFRPDGKISPFRFLQDDAKDELEQLARLEHDRWWKERRDAGWRYGSEKSVERRTSPYLVPWEELPDDMKDYDRETIRIMPNVLAKADYEIRRDATHDAT